MPFLILALALLVIVGALSQGLGVTNRQIRPVADIVADPAALSWLAYKAAVQTYVERNPAFAGTVPLDQIGVPADGPDLSTAGNFVVRDSGTTQVVTWMALSGSSISSARRLAAGDQSIGISTGNTWETPSYGNMGPLPVTVPAGDVVSCVSFTGTGF
ncbi:type IV pilus biogenesis protein PilM [Komagataeibacter rhaeticus]|uniref:hypothetical protein n=1 Tax=Komagataeibacter rhaeticus TaxID=215221 RepID=UPI001CD58047|nr:hypothetical protein [Komagataeibacter rhaeticus]